MAAPAVLVARVAKTPVAVAVPQFLSVTLKSLHSLGSTEPLPPTTVVDWSASTGTVAPTPLYTTRAKSSSSAEPLLGTPSELMLAAVTTTANGPVTPAGRKTLSTLFRRSALPPVTEFGPLNTLPL